MNKWLMHKVLRAKYRKYAIWITMGVHVIMIIVYSLFFIQTEVSNIEDEIEVDLFYELPQIIKKQPKPTLKKEIPKPKIEMPTLEKRTVQKQVKVIQPKQPLEIKKMDTPARAGGDIQPPPKKNIDVNAPELSETPDLSTDVKLKASAESILSSTASDIGDTLTKSYGRRKGQHIKNPRKRTAQGSAKRAKETGAGQDIGNGVAGIGAGEGQGIFDPGAAQPTFRSIIKEVTEDIIDSSGGAPVDVVFVVDASGSMQENINAVAEHLSEMVDVYKASEIDYQLGLTHFSVDRNRENRIRVFQLTQDLSKIQTALYGIQLGGDEHALDAINETVIQQRFRSAAIKHLIVVTDEPFTSLHGFSVDDAINLCRKNKVYVNVLGIDKPKHKYLAAVTGGTWYPIPVNLNRQ